MKYFIKRFVSLIVTLFIVSIACFLVFQVIPGDSALSRLGTNATEESLNNLREEMGLNDPIPQRYCEWLGGFVRGDFGTSLSKNMPVKELLSGTFTVTLSLAAVSFLLIVIIGIPLGILFSSFKNKKVTRAFDIFNQIVMAVPSFFIGILFCMLFGVVLRVFTPGVYPKYNENYAGFLAYLIAPAFSVAIPKIAMVVKFFRTSVDKEMQEDYVRTAYSKGNSRLRVLYHHVLKNALIPVVTTIGVTAAEILAGSIVAEQIFSLPGLGRALVSAIVTRDYPVVQTIVVYIAAAVIIINFIVDLIYRKLDPRIDSIQGGRNE